eukprot:12917986-Prorocentrum_lima.AAC.1
MVLTRLAREKRRHQCLVSMSATATAPLRSLPAMPFVIQAQGITSTGALPAVMSSMYSKLDKAT